MTDIEAAIRTWLASIAGIAAIAGQRIIASVSLPDGYRPDQGPALLFKVQGGGQDYSSQVLNPRVQFQSYAETEADARRLDRAVYDGINDRQFTGIKMARLDVLPVLLAEPETGWPFVLTFYRFWIANS